MLSHTTRLSHTYNACSKNKNMRRERRRVTLDLLLIAVSIIAALVLLASEAAQALLAQFTTLGYAGNFLAGMLFTSVFTTAPAMVLIGELAQRQNALSVALWGGLGAALGDYALFRLIRGRLSRDARFLLRRARPERWPLICKTCLFRRFMPLLGALTIASPLPDELGLALLGLSNIKTSLFLPLSFALNAAGILTIALVVQRVV